MKRILFVDDERPVLDGLRGRLHYMRSKWDMTFVESGARALAELEQKSCDVIVTDMRMPAMDGAQLLKTVSATWPHTVRIVLSGYSEQDQTMRLVPFAHQYLSKPCQPQQLEQVINRCLHLHELIHAPELRAVVGRLRQIPAVPQTYAKLQQALGSEDVSVQEVARIVAADPAIVAKILQMVNSAFFRLAKPISKIEQAVSYLGFSTIRNLTLSLEVFSKWPKQGADTANPELLQAHAQKVAAVAKTLAAGTQHADSALLAGLLHDIGYWVLVQECSKELAQAVTMARNESIPLYLAERRTIGASHAEIGAYLLGLWGVPYSVIEAVAYHHEHHIVRPTEFDVLAILSVAHVLTPLNESEVFKVPAVEEHPIDEAAFVQMNAPFDWTEAQQRAAAAIEPKE